MDQRWFALQSGLSPAALNMATDEALLENVAGLGSPVLRFYGWTEPAATFGYSQRFDEVANWTHLRPLIRRPTGGGLVPHDADWTYSLMFPPGHFWYRLQAVESYRLVHQWIQSAFQSLGVPTDLAAAPRKAGPGRCFIGAEQFDLLWQGMKMAGAAQRRTRAGLLIQGSIQPRNSPWPRADWERAMLDRVPVAEKVHWSTLALDEAVTCRIEQLVSEKYSQAAYNQRR